MGIWGCSVTILEIHCLHSAKNPRAGQRQQASSGCVAQQWRSRQTSLRRRAESGVRGEPWPALPWSLDPPPLLVSPPSVRSSLLPIGAPGLQASVLVFLSGPPLRKGLSAGVRLLSRVRPPGDPLHAPVLALPRPLPGHPAWPSCLAAEALLHLPQ